MSLMCQHFSYDKKIEKVTKIYKSQILQKESIPKENKYDMILEERINTKKTKLL